MRTVFVADDGTAFDDEWDCKDYEFRKSLDLDSIEIYDQYGTRYDPLSEDGYNKAVKIIIKTERAVSALNKIAKYTGFTLYEDVNSVGTWIFKEHDYRQEFVRRNKKMTILKEGAPKTYIYECGCIFTGDSSEVDTWDNVMGISYPVMYCPCCKVKRVSGDAVTEEQLKDIIEGLENYKE